MAHDGPDVDSPPGARSDSVGAFVRRPFPPARVLGIDTLRWGSKRHHIPLLLEVDITEARARIARLEDATGVRPSFAGWAIHCLARAASEHPEVHALRHGRRRLITFRDVDVATAVERRLPEEDGGAVPLPYVVRRAHEKSVRAIHEEIRAAQRAPAQAGGVLGGAAPGTPAGWLAALALRAPAWVRDLLFWRRIAHNAFLAKRISGTVMLTSVAAAAAGGAGWGIPIGIHPLIVALGGIDRRPGLVPGSDQVTPREYLGLTVLFDHDVTDGVPAARFAGRLRELMTSADGLELPKEPGEPGAPGNPGAPAGAHLPAEPGRAAKLSAPPPATPAPDLPPLP